MPAKDAHAVKFHIYPLGDAAVVVQFGNTIQKAIFTRIHMLAGYLDKHPFEGLVEYVPAFTTLTVFYNPWVLSEQGKQNPYEKAVKIIEGIIKENLPVKDGKPEQTSQRVNIPVCYGGEFGPDLEYVAAHNQLTQQEVIRRHASVDYLVYMIGFAPGFPYLGGMDTRIAAPRKETPRKLIPAGSVGIAGTQTGIYPMETPGGWQLIGQTPLRLFNPCKENPTLLNAGDLVRFIPISEKEYANKKEKENEYSN